MTTVYLSDTPQDLEKAAALLRQGETVAFPTETVYGLGADARSEAAVARIFAAKGRPQDNPLIVHIACAEDLLPLVKNVSAAARVLMETYWPGPLTLIFERSDVIPAAVSGGLDTLAVRLPAHPVARELIRLCGFPVAAPSANRSGSPSPTAAAHVAQDLDGRVAAIVDGGTCGVGVESTVVDMTGEVPRVLRPGGVTVEMLREAVGEVEVDDAVVHRLAEGAKAASPGMKYKHYAPRARVVLLRGDAASCADYIRAHAEEGTGALCFDGEEQGLPVPTMTYGRREDAAAQAERVFAALREADDRGFSVLYVSCPSTDGVGLAVYNRLLRAAAFEVIELA